MAETPLPVGDVVKPVSVAASKRADAIEAILRPAILEASADPTTRGLSAIPSEVEDNIRAISVAAANDQNAVSAMGVEAPTQSPITWIAVSGTLLAGISIAQTVASGIPFDMQAFPWTILMTEIGTFGTSVGTLIARWAPGLKLFFWDKGN